MSELTVGDLVAMRQLGCTVIAGSNGLERKVVWAHVCELKDPWNWVTSGELLMTTGICISAEETDQVDLITNLHRLGISGIAIGDDLMAPPLCQAMLDKADQLDFPVLTVVHATPFSAIGRTVAVAAQSEQISRIARLSRLYDVARSPASSSSLSLLERLSSELGHQLHVVDVELGTEALSRPGHVDAEIVRELRRRVAPRLDRLPPRISVTVANNSIGATAFALSTHRKCMLVVNGTADVDFDAFVLLHAQSLIGIEIERATRANEYDDEIGAELFQQIIDGTVGSDAAKPRLAQADLDDQPWTVIAVDARHLRTVRTLLNDAAVARLSCLIGEQAYVLLGTSDLDAATEQLKAHLPFMGVSAPTSSVQRLPDSVKQARWALQAAYADGVQIAEYSTAAPLFLPRTLSEAEFAARAVLGDLIDHDTQHASNLIETLEVFLTEDRSWSVTAQKLMIHRQTLGYRLKRIEAITGRSTKSSADLAALWMALVARRISRDGRG